MSILYSWSEDFSSNDAKIDSQHKYLFKLINDFANQQVENVTELDTLLFLDKLHDYCDFHFKEEEALMIKNDYPLLEHHAKLHNELKQTVKRTQEKIKNKETEIPHGTIINFCLHWLNEHIAKQDLIFVNFMKNRHYTLDKKFINRSCEIMTINNRFLGIGRIKSIGENFVVIENTTKASIPLHFNDLVKITSLSTKTNKTQTFVAVVYYSHAGIIKLFNPTIIQTENKRQYFRVPLNNTQATVEINNQAFSAQIVDINEAGLQITAQTNLQLDDIVKANFELQNSEFTATYKVVRVIQKKQNEILYGLQLEEIDEESYKQIAMFVFNKQCMLRNKLK